MPIAAIVAIAVVIIVLAAWLIITYRSFVTLRNLVQEGRRRIDLELNARYGLISNLVEIAAPYMRDSEPLEAIIEARSAATEPVTGMTQRGKREDDLSQAISRAHVFAEQNAELSADQSFSSIRNELVSISKRIDQASRFYNANARDLNAKRESFPSNLVASAFHFGHAEYFQAEPTRIALASDLHAAASSV
ncbi:MAG: LemA family protein, partial [Ancrocorticia sp.]